MRKSKGKKSTLPVAFVASALLVVGFSFLSSVARSVGVVEPHVWVETAPADGKSIERQSRYRAVGAVMDGEVARTAERHRPWRRRPACTPLRSAEVDARRAASVIFWQDFLLKIFYRPD
jgi:hypothetical protein